MWEPAEAAELLFEASVHRGYDSFGYLSNNGKFDLKKFAIPATIGVRTGLVEIPKTAHWFIGHVRQATHGDPNNPSNNHPIVHKDWVGVHNGIIWNYNSILNRTGREDPLAEVDSEAIFAAVHNWGLHNGLKALDGDMAAALVNTKHPETIHLATTEYRPLWIGETATGATYFASEKAILLELGIEYTALWMFDEYSIATFDHGKMLSYERYRDTPKRKKAPVQSGWGEYYTDETDDKRIQKATWEEWERSVTEQEEEAANGMKVLYYHRGKLLTEKQYFDIQLDEEVERRLLAYDTVLDSDHGLELLHE